MSLLSVSPCFSWQVRYITSTTETSLLLRCHVDQCMVYNEACVCAGAEVHVPENLPAPVTVYTVLASDPDVNDTLTVTSMLPYQLAMTVITPGFIAYLTYGDCPCVF